MGNLIDISGQRFGRLTAIKRGENRGKAVRWECVCDCGNHTLSESYPLLRGVTVSCGCYQKEVVSQTMFKHGQSRRSPTYNTWCEMLQRCKNHLHHKFAKYGAIGVTVCDEWLSFENFFGDMGERPAGCTIDRINGELGYNKENCRWATIKQQQRNIKTNRLITYNGETRCVSEWAEITGIHKNTIIQRLNNGRSDDDLFSTPLRRGRGARSPQTVMQE